MFDAVDGVEDVGSRIPQLADQHPFLDWRARVNILHSGDERCAVDAHTREGNIGEGAEVIVCQGQQRIVTQSWLGRALRQDSGRLLERVFAGADPFADLVCSAEAAVVHETELQPIVDDDGRDLKQSQPPRLGPNVCDAGRIKALNVMKVDFIDERVGVFRLPSSHTPAEEVEENLHRGPFCIGYLSEMIAGEGRSAVLSDAAPSVLCPPQSVEHIVVTGVNGDNQGADSGEPPNCPRQVDSGSFW